VRCRSKKIDDKWFVGCTLQGWQGPSRPNVYLVGVKHTGAKVLLAPVNGNTKQTFQKILPIALRNFGTKFSPALFAAPVLPISRIIEQFE